MPSNSFWLRDTFSPPTAKAFSPVDVIVVGAGIVGVIAAYLLKMQGLKVALLEGNYIGSGTTGHSTGKLTVQHGLTYAALEDEHGFEVAKKYADAQKAGQSVVVNLINQLKMECNLESVTTHVYTTDEDRKIKVYEEAMAAQRAGIEGSYTDADWEHLNTQVVASFATPNQYQFHPVKFLRKLAMKTAWDKSYVVEYARALSVKERGDKVIVDTTKGPFVADYVIAATHMPFMDKGEFSRKVKMTADLVVSGPIRPGVINGSYLSVDPKDSHSYRTIRGDDGVLNAIVLGEHHKPGTQNLKSRHNKLEKYAKNTFGLFKVENKWSAFDYRVHDNLPLIGRFYEDSDKILFATGFDQWGLTNGANAATMLSDMVLGIDNPFAEVFNPHRGVPDKIVADTKVSPTAKNPEDLDEGEHTIKKQGDKIIGAYRDKMGRLTIVDAECRHLGCTVAFNDDENTWDCPCHGSRYNLRGDVIHGPAVQSLKRPDE